jgi:hypothetical protein
MYNVAFALARSSLDAASRCEMIGLSFFEKEKERNIEKGRERERARESERERE